MGILKDFKEWLNKADPRSEVFNRRYEEAEKQGISLYTLCSSVTPEFSYDFSTENPYEGKFNIRFVRTIKLNPNI